MASRYFLARKIVRVLLDKQEQRRGRVTFDELVDLVLGLLEDADRSHV